MRTTLALGWRKFGRRRRAIVGASVSHTLGERPGFFGHALDKTAFSSVGIWWLGKAGQPHVALFPADPPQGQMLPVLELYPDLVLVRGTYRGSEAGRGRAIARLVSRPRSAWAGYPSLADLWARTRGDPRVTIAVLDGPVDRQSSRTCWSQPRDCGISRVGRSGSHDSGDHPWHSSGKLDLRATSARQPGRGCRAGCRGVVIPIYHDSFVHFAS